MGDDDPTDVLDSVEDFRNTLIPLRASDIGDVRYDANPRAEVLGYSTREMDITTNFAGDRIIFDTDNDDAKIECDGDTFIEDVMDWN